jgi:exopolyphosphatase / guanosine-5'-triphosphate,3'-diphosphate pyrophosphatase
LKISIIDIGSNTIKLVIYDVKKDNSFMGIHQESSKVRLGESLAYSDSLKEQSILKSIDVLLMYRDIAKLESANKVICVGTSAVREAKNNKYFIDQVLRKTGLKVRVLSGEEEAYYSYLGASMSTCIPNGLFFDLGGGSLEVVYTEDFKVKKVQAFPLGALRLTRTFANQDGSFSKKDCDNMSQTILDTLPSKKSYRIGIDSLLVGIGGTLRALGRYDQKRAAYPFEKIHNYRLTLSTIDSLRKDLSYLKTDVISSLLPLDSTRVETIVAGTHVIHSIMKKFDFEELVISGYGLREGILASFIQDPNTLQNHSIESLEKQILKILSYHCYKHDISGFGLDDMMHDMIYYKLLKEREVEILSYALYTLSGLPETNKHYSLFYHILDEDYSRLTYREQVILALSIVYSKKIRTGEELFYKYNHLLKPQNLKSIQKIAILVKLARIIIKTRSQIRIKLTENEKMIFTIIPTHKSFPNILLKQIIQKVSTIFDIPVQYNLPNKIDTIKHSTATDKIISIKSQT